MHADSYVLENKHNVHFQVWNDKLMENMGETRKCKNTLDFPMLEW